MDSVFCVFRSYSNQLMGNLVTDTTCVQETWNNEGTGHYDNYGCNIELVVNCSMRRKNMLATKCNSRKRCIVSSISRLFNFPCQDLHVESPPWLGAEAKSESNYRNFKNKFRSVVFNKLIDSFLLILCSLGTSLQLY